MFMEANKLKIFLDIFFKREILLYFLFKKKVKAKILFPSSRLKIRVLLSFCFSYCLQRASEISLNGKLKFF